MTPKRPGPFGCVVFCDRSRFGVFGTFPIARARGELSFVLIRFGGRRISEIFQILLIERHIVVEPAFFINDRRLFAVRQQNPGMEKSFRQNILFLRNVHFSSSKKVSSGL